MFKIFVGLFFTWLWWLNFDHVNSIEGLQSFDPYAILDLDIMADEKAIKKQYRKMSLQLHPDKNPDDPQAVQNFIRLTKAYNVSLPHTRLTLLNYRSSQTRLHARTSKSTVTQTVQAASRWPLRCQSSCSKKKTRFPS